MPTPAAYHDPDDLAPKRVDQYTLEEMKETWMARMSRRGCIFISAAQRINIDGLRELLYASGEGHSHGSLSVRERPAVQGRATWRSDELCLIRSMPWSAVRIPTWR
jgi:hypothetical protein